MNLIKKFLTICFAIITVSLLVHFRTVPTGKLWDNYTVMYVPVAFDDQTVQQALIQSDISDFICLDNQSIPKEIQKNSVEYAMIGIDDISLRYLTLRKNFFFDSSKEYRLYYVPSEQKDKLNNCIKLLENKDGKLGIDSSSAYPIILPLILIVLFIILICFSKNKLVFALPSIIPLIFLICNPFYPCTFSCIFLFTSNFIVSNLWQRTGYTSSLIHNWQFILFNILAIICAASNSIFTLLFYVMTFISTLLILVVLKDIHNEILSKTTYNFLMIRPAARTNIYCGKGRTIILSLIFCIGGVFAYFLINSTATFSSNFARVLLPGKSQISSKELTNLEEYCNWYWDITSFPYKSLNKNDNDFEVSYPKFSLENGKIVQTNFEIKYNDEYKNNIINGIDLLPFNSIEKVLKSQGIESVYGYTASSSYTVNIFSIIMMFISLGILLFIYFSVIIKKGGKK